MKELIAYTRKVTTNSGGTPYITLGKEAWAAIKKPREVKIVLRKGHLEIWPKET